MAKMAKNKKFDEATLAEFVGSSTQMLAKFAVEIRALLDILIEHDLTTREEYRARLRSLAGDLFRFTAMHGVGERLDEGN